MNKPKRREPKYQLHSVSTPTLLGKKPDKTTHCVYLHPNREGFLVHPLENFVLLAAIASKSKDKAFSAWDVALQLGFENGGSGRPAIDVDSLPQGWIDMFNLPGTEDVLEEMLYRVVEAKVLTAFEVIFWMLDQKRLFPFKDESSPEHPYNPHKLWFVVNPLEVRMIPEDQLPTPGVA